MTKYALVLSLAVIILFAGCSHKSKLRGINIDGVENPVILLNGIWKFSLKPPDRFWENETNLQEWSDIHVPGECQMQGFPIRHDQPYAYKKKFVVPRDYKGKHIELQFSGVYSYARVWVNGSFVRDHYGGFTKWSCNITDYVVPGEAAVLTVEFVDRTDDISYGSGYAKHQIGGILRDVELVALPMQHFTGLWFETELDEAYKNAELKIFHQLSESGPAEIKFELFDADNNVVMSLEKNAESKGQISIPVQNPLKWDAEHPNLYTLVTILSANGKEIMKRSDKIGFREVEIDGNRMLVNGNPVKLRGACRHDIHPLLGRLTTPEYDLKDVLLAKESNMNFIRTSHYPPSQAFLEYCDEYGIYVEDETAVCFVGSHRTEAYRSSGASQNDPAFTDRYLSQLEEMVNNHRNHPSVIIWSIGNENSFGSNFTESFKWVKSNDKTRPVIYSYPGQVPDSLKNYEIISMHYPSWSGDLKQHGIITEGFASDDMPMIFDEWAHVACYNNFELQEDPNVRNFWGQSLDSMWTNLFDSEGGLGGAIWCMLDETFMLPQNLPGFNEWWGILDKNVIPATYMGPCVGYGEWGIVDTWRRKKPEFWTTKKAYSPVKIYEKQIHHFKAGEILEIPVHNRFDHTNFNELKFVWKYGSQTGELEGIDLEPHEKGVLEFPEISWNKDEKLNIRILSSDTFLVDEYNIQIGEKEVYKPEITKGNLNVTESGDLINVAGKNIEFMVDRKSGRLLNVKKGSEIIIHDGPYINLKVPGARVQYSTIEMDQLFKNWKLTRFDFIVEEGIAKIISSGECEGIKAKFTIEADEKGTFSIQYLVENLPANKNIQEAGIVFHTGDSFEKIYWDRNGYFTAYPDNHIGRNLGDADLLSSPEMKYREKPLHGWEKDNKGFYYFGLDKELPYVNDVRSLKENIYSYRLATKKQSGLEIYADGHQACRFDRINGGNTLIINDYWDYNSLLWGNYSKRIKSDTSIAGEIIMTLK